MARPAPTTKLVFYFVALKEHFTLFFHANLQLKNSCAVTAHTTHCPCPKFTFGLGKGSQC